MVQVKDLTWDELTKTMLELRQEWLVLEIATIVDDDISDEQKRAAREAFLRYREVREEYFERRIQELRKMTQKRSK